MLRKRTACVLVAEPGAGKTTRLPLALRAEAWLLNGGERRKLIMLEPRRIAARSAVTYMAAQLGEKPGQTVGYRIRGEIRVGPHTRIEVVTEGILTRMLQNDPALEGVGGVIFDEFHERSIHADLGLALCLESQRLVRPDLRIVVMSATLETASLSALMGDAPVIACPGRSHPVEIRYLAERSLERLEIAVADAVRRALREEPTGDLLVFLPGRGEIFRVEERLLEAQPLNTVIVPLYADASSELQERALSPDREGRRKIILATSLAETSLTVPGVRVVIDSGYSRLPGFDVRRGMGTLETVPVSRAAAEQRSGRAGRQEPGVCYRLWTAARHRELPPFHPPEITQSDLTSLLLEVAAWGESDPSALPFLTAPPAPAVERARGILRDLGAIDERGRITAAGREFSRLGVHPRLAKMLIAGKMKGLGALAGDVAAILEEGSFGMVEAEYDLGSRWHRLDEYRRRGGSARRGGGHRLARVVRQAERLHALLGSGPPSGDPAGLGLLVALAYPERVGKRRGEGDRRYLLRSGVGAVLPEQSALHRHEFLAVAELAGGGDDARILLAEPIAREEIEEIFRSEMVARAETTWDPVARAVRSRERVTLGGVILRERAVAVSPDAVVPVMLEAIRRQGVAQLPWQRDAERLRIRSEWFRSSGFAPNGWPDLSLPHLEHTLEEWLGPYLHGVHSWDELGTIDFTAVLEAVISWEMRRRLDEDAPSHLELPTGTRVSIDYAATPPRIAVRLQEMFGQVETPRLARGRVGLVVELLSPAGRPLQVTADLASFWRNSYTEVRKEMQGRYPRHPWPADPLTATPTRRAKRAL